MNHLKFAGLASLGIWALSSVACGAEPPVRAIEIDVSAAGPVLDRFFDLAVGSDYPGTLVREDSQQHLKRVADELGFRYLHFHDIFHDTDSKGVITVRIPMRSSDVDLVTLEPAR